MENAQTHIGDGKHANKHKWTNSRVGRKAKQQNPEKTKGLKCATKQIVGSFKIGNGPGMVKNGGRHDPGKW